MRRTITALLASAVAALVLLVAVPGTSDAAGVVRAKERHVYRQYYQPYYSYYRPWYGYPSGYYYYGPGVQVYRYPYGLSGYNYYYGPRVGVTVGPLQFQWWR